MSRHQLKAHTITSHKVCMQMMREPSVLNACFCSNDSEAKLLFAAEHSCVARTFAKFKNMPAESIQVRWCFRYGAQNCSLLPWKRIVNTAACVIVPLSESGSGWPLYGTTALQHHIHRFEQLKISLFVASGTRHSFVRTKSLSYPRPANRNLVFRHDVSLCACCVKIQRGVVI